MNQIRIVSAGDGRTTKIYDEDGKEMRGVSKVTIEIKPFQPNKAVLEFTHVFLDVAAEYEGPK